MSDHILTGGSTMRGDGGVFRRGRIWWVRYSAPGVEGAQEMRESSKSESEAAAQRLLRRRLREVGNHRDGIQPFQGPSAERLTVGDLLEALFRVYETKKIKSLRHTTGHAKPVREFFGHRKALAVTPDLVRTYVAQRREEGVATATINRELAVLKRAFSVAAQERKIGVKPYIPSAGPEDNARGGFFEAHEFERMLAHLDPLMQEMARFGFRTGWRPSEIRALTWDRVDRAARELRLRTTKNGRPRLLAMDDGLAALIERMWTARQFTRRGGTTGLSEFVFHKDGRPLTESVFCKRWARARDAAGLKGRYFYDFRRTAVRNFVRGGVPETVAMAISGHVTRSVFDRYNITSTADTLAALEKQREYVEKAAVASNVESIRRN